MPDGLNNQGTSPVAAPVDHSMMINRAANETTDVLDSFRNDFPTKLVGGKTLTDLMNEADAYNAQSDYLLANYPNVNFQDNSNYFDLNKAIGNVSFTGKGPEGKTLAALSRPIDLGPGQDFDRYKSSEDFHTYGYTPGLGRQQEYKYGNAMSWGDTIGKAIGGGSQLAWDTFAEGWKGWGRMTEALFSWDGSKLMGSEQERYEIAKKQEDIFNKYAIYDTEDSQDSLWNRQFFGTMLQQSGFTIGAIAQFAVEQYLTAGLGGAISGLAKASSLTKGLKGLRTANELQNDFRKASAVVTASTRTSEKLGSTVKNLLPFYNTVSDIAKMNKAGAGLAQMTMTGLGGIKRGLSEFNMARSESIFEAAGTYKQLKDKLITEYTEKYGEVPTGKELEKIKQIAENASHDNFYTNVGVLAVMNRLQFNNMFKSFKQTRNIFNEAAASLSDEAFQITGKVGEKQLTKAYQKSWFFGRLGAVRSIAQDFGGKKAAWEATKMLGKGLTKIEGSEGVQELLQEASNKGLSDYYYDLYHGQKGYTDKMGRVLDSIQNPLTDMQGMKTFLMGALTGALISPGTKAISKINETIADRQNKKRNPNYQNKKEQAAEAIALVNALYDKSGVSEFKKEWLANIKVQNKAAETMEEAAKNHNRYVFNNVKDSAFAKTIASAIKLNMYDSVRDSIKELGDSMTPEEFKQAFGIDPTEKNKQDVKTFTKSVADQVDDYYTTYTNLKDTYGDRVLPELYKNNTPEEYKQALIAKQALDDVIEILSTNTYKAKQAVKRAADLQTKISSNKNIGASSMEVLTKMGSEEALNDHMDMLEREIKLMSSPDATLTPEQREILKDKKKELELAKKWQESHKEVVDNTDEEYSPTAETRAYKSYADLVNLFNKRAKKNVAITKQEVDDSFIDIIDYIRLNKDNKSYVDAVNFLTDPYNLELITNSMIDAHKKVNETFKKEHKEDVKRATDTEDEYTEDDLKDKGKETTKKETTAKKPDVLINGVPAEIIAIEDDPSNPDIKVASYRYMTDKVSETEDELAAREGVFYFNKQTKEYTNEDGEPISVTKYVEEPQPEPEPKPPTPEPEKEVSLNALKQLEDALKGNSEIEDLVARLKDLREINDAYDWVLKSFPQELVDDFRKGDTDARDKLLDLVIARIKEMQKEPTSPAIQEIEERRKKSYNSINQDKQDVEEGLPVASITYFLPPGKTTDGRRIEDVPVASIERWTTETFTVEGGFIDEEETINTLKSIVDAKYDAEIAALEQSTDEDVDEDNIPDYAQPSERTIKALMQADVEYANKDFQVGFRQIAPAQSLGNTTDIVKVETIGDKVRYTRDKINPDYVFPIATSEFMPGQKLEYEVITDQEDYDRMNENRLTKERYNRSEIFDENGKIKANYDDVPIGVYSIIDGKRTLIGTVHEPLWIQYQINGVYTHIATPEGISPEEHLKNELAANRKLRKTILDSFNKNAKFVHTGQVKTKSPGILKLLEKPGTLKERVNPKIAEGGVDNRHGVFAIVRNGTLETYRNVQATNVQDSEFLEKNIDDYKGVPVLLLPTPVGKFVHTFFTLPKVNSGQANFIIEAWKAFTGIKENPEIIDAVYKSLGMEKSDTPQIGVLRTYIDQYITSLESKKISRIGNGSDVPSGNARINIFDDGNLSIEVKDMITKEYVSKTIRKEADIPDNITQLLANLRTTIKFPSVKNENLAGINSKQKVDFLSFEDGKLVTRNMTYNEYIMEGATTLVEKGTESKNKNNDWVYHANPVIQMTLNEIKDDSPEITEAKIQNPDPASLGEKKEDKGAALLAALKAQKVTDQQIEEKKEECNTTESLKTKINKF